MGEAGTRCEGHNEIVWSRDAEGGLKNLAQTGRIDGQMMDSLDRVRGVKELMDVQFEEIACRNRCSASGVVAPIERL